MAIIVLDFTCRQGSDKRLPEEQSAILLIHYRFYIYAIISVPGRERKPGKLHPTDCRSPHRAGCLCTRTAVVPAREWGKLLPRTILTKTERSITISGT